MRQIEGCSLWFGHIGDAANLSAIEAHGIQAVVDLALNESPLVLPRDLTYCRFPLLDGPGNQPWMLRAAVETVACLCGLVRRRSSAAVPA